jgi:hypothetical protein
MRNLHAHITRTATAARWAGAAKGSRVFETVNPTHSLTVIRLR